MHSAIVFIDQVNHDDRDEHRNWQSLEGEIERIKARATDIETLAESCWLIPLGNGASSLAGVVKAAEARKLGHRILFFENAPQWVQGKP